METNVTTAITWVSSSLFHLSSFLSSRFFLPHFQAISNSLPPSLSSSLPLFPPSLSVFLSFCLEMESSARELFRLKAIQVSISGPAAAEAGIREKERIVNQYVPLSRIFDRYKTR